MNLLDKFSAVDIKAETRISNSDQAVLRGAAGRL